MDKIPNNSSCKNIFNTIKTINISPEKKNNNSDLNKTRESTQNNSRPSRKEKSKNTQETTQSSDKNYNDISHLRKKRKPSKDISPPLSREKSKNTQETMQSSQKYNSLSSSKENKEKSKSIQENTPNSQKSKERMDYEKDFSKMEDLLEYTKIGCDQFNEKFEIIEQLKKGGSGYVYLGRLKANPKKLVILKFLLKNAEKKNNTTAKNNSNNSKKDEKLQHYEIMLHNKLRHKNICEVYGYFRIKEGTCIVMEYFKYLDLENFKSKIVQRSSFSESYLCYITISVLNALQYLHEKNNIIHMDIKPQNILINEYLIIKLTDFSVSFCYKDKNPDDIIEVPPVGTSYFMSPEVLDSTKNKIKVKDASKIDLYSLGVTLYVLAFCDYPYKLRDVEHKNYKGIKSAIEKNDLEFHNEDNEFSEMFINFLKKLLEKDINDRYDIRQALNDPWVKGSYILLDEKEKLFNSGKFLIQLLVDGIKEFTTYANKNKENENQNTQN